MEAREQVNPFSATITITKILFTGIEKLNKK
jgi:hypothetical protein